MKNGKKGFGSMDPQRVREIASMGGQASHRLGTAHEFTSETARLAGLKGAQTRNANRAQRQAADVKAIREWGTTK